MPGERKNKKQKQKQRLFKQSSAMIHMGRTRETVDTEHVRGMQRPAVQSTAKPDF